MLVAETFKNDRRRPCRFIIRMLGIIVSALSRFIFLGPPVNVVARSWFVLLRELPLHLLTGDSCWSTLLPLFSRYVFAVLFLISFIQWVLPNKLKVLYSVPAHLIPLKSITRVDFYLALGCPIREVTVSL